MSKERREIEDLGIEESAGFKNLVAIRDYTKVTRENFRVLQKDIDIYKNQIIQQGKAIELVKLQLTELLIKVHSNNKTV